MECEIVERKKICSHVLLCVASGVAGVALRVGEAWSERVATGTAAACWVVEV